ncbi:MAG: STAS domain-containing protein [Solirubrobacterales bacterium]
MHDQTDYRTPGSLTIATVRDGDTYVVRATGELDLSNCAQFDREVRAAEVSDAARILLDLDGLQFIDSAGLTMIRRAMMRNERTGRLRITRGRGYVADLFRLTAFDQTLPFAGMQETPAPGPAADA